MMIKVKKKMNQNLEYQILNYKQMISNFSNLNNQQNNIGMIPINQNIILPHILINIKIVI